MLRVRWYWGLAVWVVGSLAAIAVIGDAPWLGVGIALVSGLLFGLLLWLEGTGLTH